MELEIEPQAAPEEQEAIRIAFERLAGGAAEPPAYRSIWRQEAIRENALDPGPNEPDPES
jgi:hypothetical protein